MVHLQYYFQLVALPTGIECRYSHSIPQNICGVYFYFYLIMYMWKLNQSMNRYMKPKNNTSTKSVHLEVNLCNLLKYWFTGNQMHHWSVLEIDAIRYFPNLMMVRLLFYFILFYFILLFMLPQFICSALASDGFSTTKSRYFREFEGVNTMLDAISRAIPEELFKVSFIILFFFY